MAYRFEYRASFWQDYSAALAYIAGSLKNPLAAGVYGGLLVCNTFPPRHCEPVTDVTGVAIRIPSGQLMICEKTTASGGRIATPVCALARNDRRGLARKKGAVHLRTGILRS